MAYSANVYQVIIVSPGDVPRERQLAREIVLGWNTINSRDKQVCLIPVGWEFNSSPEMGDRAQKIINDQILDESDLLIGIFWTRIGSPTGDSISGSVEEIEKHIETGKPAMLYFSKVPVVLDSIDSNQYTKLKEFEESCKKNGLVESYISIEDFEKKLTRQLALKIVKNDYFKKIDSSVESVLQNINAEIELVKSLTDTEKQLLIEASEDSHGRIMKLSFQGGFEIQTNRKRLNENIAPRTAALWESTFKSLLNQDLIEEKGFKGEMFALTLLGYRVSDLLKREK